MFQLFNRPSCGGCQGANPMMGGFGPQAQMMGMMGIVSMLMSIVQMFMMNSMMMGGQQMPMYAGSPNFGGGGPNLTPSGGQPLNNFLGGPTPGSFDGGNFAPPGNGTVSPRTQDFINKAKAKQGAPYVFGAAGNGKYDCSGLVYASLNEAGVKVPRLAARGYQAKYKNNKVSKENLQPGDLVFFHSPNTRGIPAGQASHVEIYLGNGMTMGTDNPKEGAKIEPINWKTFIGGARVPELA